MRFRVKAEDVNMAKLAGGIYLRTSRRHETILEGMGNKSIQNCLRSLVLVNKYAQRHRDEDPSQVSWFHRVAFVPQLRKSSDMLWVSMKVVGLEADYAASEGPPGDRVRVGPDASVEGLCCQKATTIYESQH